MSVPSWSRHMMRQAGPGACQVSWRGNPASHVFILCLTLPLAKLGHDGASKPWAPRGLRGSWEGKGWVSPGFSPLSFGSWELDGAFLEVGKIQKEALSPSSTKLALHAVIPAAPPSFPVSLSLSLPVLPFSLLPPSFLPLKTWFWELE